MGPFYNEQLVYRPYLEPIYLEVFPHKVTLKLYKFDWKHLKLHQLRATLHQLISMLKIPRNKIQDDQANQLNLQGNLDILMR